MKNKILFILCVILSLLMIVVSVYYFLTTGKDNKKNQFEKLEEETIMINEIYCKTYGTDWTLQNINVSKNEDPKWMCCPYNYYDPGACVTFEEASSH